MVVELLIVWGCILILGSLVFAGFAAIERREAKKSAGPMTMADIYIGIALGMIFSGVLLGFVFLVSYL